MLEVELSLALGRARYERPKHAAGSEAEAKAAAGDWAVGHRNGRAIAS